MEADLPLIQISEEDDSLLPFPDQTPFNYSPSHAKNLKYGIRMEKPSSSSSEVINNKENISSNNVEVPKLGMGPMQMKRRKKGAGYNLRKSLAWDRAFFTDEGILDPLELTLITGIDANTHGGGLSSISEDGNSSFSSDASCSNESDDMEASKEAPLKGLRDQNRTPKGNREKTDCSVRNHGSLLHHKVTHKVVSSDHTHTNRGGSKVGGFSEPLASSLKRPANSNILKSAKKESKLPKLPISKPGSCVYATPKSSMAASRLRHNLIPKPTKNGDKNFGLKSSLQNVHDSQSKAKTGSGKVHLPVRELAQETVKNLAHSSKVASSTRSRLVQVDRANSGSEMVPDTLRLCKVKEESAPLAAKHPAQHAAANSENSLPEAARLSSSGPCHIQKASKGLMISDRLHPCESQQGLVAPARPSGLRLPSPSLRYFDLRTTSESDSLQQKQVQPYRKYGEPCPPARPSMKSNATTENIGYVGLTSSKGYGCTSTAQLSPSPNCMLNTSTKGAPDSNIYRNLVTKTVPRVGIKLEYECGDSERKKQIPGHEEIAATWKGDEGIKASHSTEQLAGNVETCQLMSKGRVEEDGQQKYAAFSITNFGQSIQHQEENSSTGADVLAQPLCEQADADKSDDAPPKVNPESHLDAGSQVFVESQEQDGIRKREYDVETTKCVTPGIESYDVVQQHGQEKNVSKVIDDKSLPLEEDDSPCRSTISIACRDSHFLVDEVDVMELKGIDTSSVPFLNFNTKQRTNNADGVDALPTTITSPRLIDPSAEEGNDGPVRDTVTQLVNGNPSAEGFNIEPTPSIKNKHKLPVTLLLHDDLPSTSTEGLHYIPTNSIKNKSQLRDTDTANGSSIKCFEATSPCISPLLNSPLSEEGTFQYVTDISDHPSQEKNFSSATISEVPGQQQYGFDVDLTLRDVAPLIDDHNPSSGLLLLRPQVEFISETASVVDDAPVKKESVLQCKNIYPQSLEKEILDTAAPTVEAQHKIPVENHKTQEMGLFIVAEKSQDSHNNIPEAKSTVQGCTGGLETHSQFQSENQTLEGSGPISTINVEDGQVQLFDGDVLVQSCSRLSSKVHDYSIENADHSLHGKQAGSSNNAIEVGRVSKSNHEPFQQESVCKAVCNVVEGSDVYECDPRPPNTLIVDVSPPVVEEIGNNDGQLCFEYRTSGSVVKDSIADHNENCSDGQSTECGDLTLTVDSELEPSVEDKTFVENITCMEYSSAGEESCSFLTDSMLEDRVLMKGSLLSTEQILDSVIVPEENSDASAQILPVVQVNGDNQHQGFVGTVPLVETHVYFTNGKSNTSFSECLLTKTTNMIEAEESTIIIGEQVDATPMSGENQTLEGSGPIGNISKPNVEDGIVQLLDGDVSVQSCSRLTSEVHDYSTENAEHSLHGKQAGFSNTEIEVERNLKSNNEHYQQESVCKAGCNVVEGSDVYECDPKSPNTCIVDVSPPAVEEISNNRRQPCVEYRISASIVIDSIAEHNENYSDEQSIECDDLTLTLDKKLEPSVEDKTCVENLTCMEYCSFPTDSMLEEKTTPFLDDQVLMKGSLLTTEKILDSVLVPEENSDDSAQILPVLQVNGDNQPQGFVGTTPSVETQNFTNGNCNSSCIVSQELTTGVETTSTPELCCLVGGDESLLTKATNMIEAEESKIIIGEQVDATPMVGEHDLDAVEDHKDATVLTKRSNSIKMQDNSLVIRPPNAVPFSDEWLAAFEAAGEEILTMKCGAVQHSPPDKSLPEPSPWSPVKKKGNQIGPYDCTKYTNAMP